MTSVSQAGVHYCDSWEIVYDWSACCWIVDTALSRPSVSYYMRSISECDPIDQYYPPQNNICRLCIHYYAYFNTVRSPMYTCSLLMLMNIFSAYKIMSVMHLSLQLWYTLALYPIPSVILLMKYTCDSLIVFSFLSMVKSVFSALHLKPLSSL